MATEAVPHLQSLLRPQTRALYVSDVQRTFDCDDELPALPLPSLKQSLDRYVESVRALATPEQLRQTRLVVAEFELGIGAQLQRMLSERAKTTKNWMDEWWLEYAYLRQREPMAPSSRFAGSFPLTDTQRPDKNNTNFHCMAEYVHWTAQFWWLLLTERLSPHCNRRGAPLSMNQWRHLFSCVRLPRPQVDEIRPYFRTETEDGLSPTHFVILCNGHIYTNTLIDPQTGLPLTVEEYRLVLERVWQCCQTQPPGPALATLTSDWRHQWAENRQRLCQLSALNCDALHTVESAVFHVVLEPAAAAAAGDGSSEQLRQLLCGDPANRWQDKTLSLVACGDSGGGHSCEHSPLDAMVLVNQGMFCQMAIVDQNVTGRLMLAPRLHLCQPRSVEFTVDSDLLSAIATVRATALSLLDNVCMLSRRFSRFGKLWLRSQSLHPDAFLQVALQLAYYRLHDRPGPTYETASTRQFWRGRTETVRSCTAQAVAFCRAMTSQAQTPIDCRRLMLTAIQTHIQLTSDSTNGRGIDRHLMALKLLAEQHCSADQLQKSIFADPMWKATGGDANFLLSTSTTGYSAANGGTIAMVTDGYGCYYSIEPHWMNFNVTTYRSGKSHSPDTFYSALHAALVDMQQLAIATSSRL